MAIYLGCLQLVLFDGFHAKKSLTRRGILCLFQFWLLKLLSNILLPTLSYMLLLLVKGETSYTSVIPCCFCNSMIWFYSLFSFSFLGCRYLRPLVADLAIVAKCHLSTLYRHEKGKLFAQLVDLLQFYEKFEINDHVGKQLTDDEVLQSHYDRFQSFQLLAFKKIPKVCYNYLCLICRLPPASFVKRWIYGSLDQFFFIIIIICSV